MSLTQGWGKRLSGFTVTEMMVGVGIMAIIAAVAVPSYRKHVSRSRQAEARAKLADMFTAQQGFYLGNRTYTSCFKAMGYDQVGSVHYYSTGINCAAASLANCGPDTAPALGSRRACNTYAYNKNGTAAANCGTVGNGNLCFNSTLGARVGSLVDCCSVIPSLVQSDRFSIAAQGNIMDDLTTYDTWAIDQNKSLVNTTSGI